MRPIYDIKEERKLSPELMNEINEDIESIIKSFSKYLEDYIPEASSDRYSKSSIVGPIGKLLSGISSSKLETKDALVGYVVSIHENTSDKWLSDEGRMHLEEGVERLLSLKQKAPNRMFAKALREIDYGVYKKKLEYIFVKRKEKEEHKDKEE